MSNNDAHRYIVAYDIALPRRLGRLHRFIVRRAVPVQYSVFVAMLSKSQLDELVTGIEAIIKPSRDDVRIYPLLRNPEITVLGKSIMPDGVDFVTESGVLLQTSPDLQRCPCANSLADGEAFLEIT